MPASMAWPKVWPKFRMARRPLSRSSSPTTQALISQNVSRHAPAQPGRAPARRPGWPSSQARKVASAIGPYLMTSARPARNSRSGRLSSVARSQITPLGLVERADHVLAQRVVDGGLATHGRVHLGQQRGGHLHKGHAAHVGGSGKAGHVAHHAAAQRKEHGLAVAAGGQQVVEDQVQRSPVLCCSPSGSSTWLISCSAGPGPACQCRAVQGVHGGVADDHGMAGLGQPLPRHRPAAAGCAPIRMS
jgi:hypothetical protein